MDKVKQVIKDFFSNLKEYIKYLMKVDFKELFVNTVILVCLVVLAAFAYIPISVIQDLIYKFIQIFVSVGLIFGQLYNWIFQILSFIVALFAFMILFNMRFADIKNKKSENKVVVKKNGSDKTEELELPKAKKADK